MVIVGIGHIDDDPQKCQLEQNLDAAQLHEPLSDDAMADIEAKVAAANKHTANVYFQLPALGPTAPRNAGVESDISMPVLGRNAVRVSWDTAYAGSCPIKLYEVLRDGKVVGTLPHRPQYTHTRFHYDDLLDDNTRTSDHRYRVVAVDAKGTRAETAEMLPTSVRIA
jgi:hypothetical protein